MRMVRWLGAVLLVFGVLLTAGSDRPVHGQSPPAKVPKVKKKANRPSQRVSAEEEKAARDFARQHHAELLPILDHLEKSLPNKYYDAIHDLHKAATRIAHLKTRDPDRYNLELKAWQLRSRIQLLAAQLQLEPEDAKLQSALRKALLEEADLQIAACEAERQRQVERLSQLDEQLRRLRGEREERVDKQIEKLTRSKRRDSPKGKDDRPASKKAAAADKPLSQTSPLPPPNDPQKRRQSAGKL